MEWSGSLLKIITASVVKTGVKRAPGMRLIYDGFPAVQTAQDLLVLLEVQPAGKRPMSGIAFLQGVKNWA
jgi:methionyl-tRNA formyltransferase